MMIYGTLERLHQRTPMTERLVKHILLRTGEAGLSYKNNRMAYRWRRFEFYFPVLSKLVGLIRFGGWIALGAIGPYRGSR